MYNQKNHQFKTFYNHKFGFHLSGPQREAFSEALKLRPKLIKTLDFSVDFLSRVRRELPDTFLIGRLFVHPQEFGRTASDAQRKGVELAERILRLEINRHSVNGQRIFDAWESLNEVLPESAPDDRHKLYDEYQVAFGRRLRSAGFEAVGFNLATGNGRGEQWLRLYPGTLETYTYLGFHEYDWPEMDRLHRLGLAGQNEPHNRVPVVGAGQGNDGMWRCLRYRRIMHEGIRQTYGDRHTVIITECGMTQGVWGGPSKDIGPWAKELTVPRDIPGGVASTPIPADDYWHSLQWYNSELMRDDYVMGACLFVTGAGSHEWETFEHVNVITTRIFAFQREINLEAASPNAAHPETVQPNMDRPPDLDRPAAGSLGLPEQPHHEVDTEPDVAPLPAPPKPRWRYTLKTGTGMGLLVGDIGVQYESILLTKPDGRTEQIISGHKPEYGTGGFETYAQQPGRYRLEFLDQQFELDLDGHFTRVIFEQAPLDLSPPPQPAPPSLPPEDFDASPEPDSPSEAGSPPEVPASPPEFQPAEPPAAEPGEAAWRYDIEIGSGLGLLVGDIGLPREPILITKPDGRTEQVISGHKPEYGLGGFETYAQKAGQYRLDFLGQVFTLTLSGQFTRVTFKQIAAPPSESPAPPPAAEAPIAPSPQPLPDPPEAPPSDPPPAATPPDLAIPEPPVVPPTPRPLPDPPQPPLADAPPVATPPAPPTSEPPESPVATPAPHPIHEPVSPPSVPSTPETPPDPDLVVSPPRMADPAGPTPPPPSPNEQLAMNNEQSSNLQSPASQPSNRPTFQPSNPPALQPSSPPTSQPSIPPPPPPTAPSTPLQPSAPSPKPSSPRQTFQPSNPPPLQPSNPPAFQPSPVNPAEIDWTYLLQLGSGLGLLVGDLGLADVPIVVIRPDNRREQVISGHKPEHGLGGFEIYAWEPGTYTLQFLGRRFHLNLLGRYTRVTFRQVPRPAGALAAGQGAAIRDPDSLLAIQGEEDISPEVQSQRSFFNSLLTILARWLSKKKPTDE